jgi:hypothetical protein
MSKKKKKKKKKIEETKKKKKINLLALEPFSTFVMGRSWIPSYAVDKNGRIKVEIIKENKCVATRRDVTTAKAIIRP